MAEAASNDVLMCIQHSTAGFLTAESASELDTTDPMTNKDFKPGKFFEVETFTVGLKLDDKDKSDGGGARTYETWRSTEKAAAAASSGRKQLFYAVPDELVVTRSIDTASPLLVQYCLNLDRITKAVLVKRGRNSAGALVGFLKMEFTELSIQAVDWTNGDVVQEVCKLKFEKLTVDYNRRKPDGTKLSAWNCSWAPE